MDKVTRLLARVVFENAAQHLWHSNFSYGEIAQLLCLKSAEQALALCEAAEIRQPKLCTGLCFNPCRHPSEERRPFCPYCARVFSVNAQLLAESGVS